MTSGPAEPGSVLDFQLHERLHQGGMATLWRVTRPDIDLPLIMKIPFTGWGEAAGAIVSFEMEQMILPRLSGAHVPRFEQVRGDRSDPRSDLFALGAVMYFLVTGERPFGNPATAGGMRARLYRDPVPPRALNPACPPWLQEIILRCLEVDPDARYQTGAQLALDLQYPDQVRLTERAQRLRRDRLPVVARRWLRTSQTPVPREQSVSGQLAQAPIIMAAVDLAPEFASLAEALRVTVWRILAIEPAARLTCVNVLKTSLVVVDTPERSGGHNPYLQRLIELKAWARPLGVLEDRIGFHVLEAVDAAAALVDYARRNHVDHIVIGARGSSTLRRYLGSVSSHVVAEAPCSVTVVRVPDRSGSPVSLREQSAPSDQESG
jgi:eukaryotic-like serine/threonine-protein kinase